MFVRLSQFAIHSSITCTLSHSPPPVVCPPSSVHCFGLQLLYLFRLTAALVLPLGVGVVNGGR